MREDTPLLLAFTLTKEILDKSLLVVPVQRLTTVVYTSYNHRRPFSRPSSLNEA